MKYCITTGRTESHDASPNGIHQPGASLQLIFCKTLHCSQKRCASCWWRVSRASRLLRSCSKSRPKWPRPLLSLQWSHPHAVSESPSAQPLLVPASGSAENKLPVRIRLQRGRQEANRCPLRSRDLIPKPALKPASQSCHLGHRSSEHRECESWRRQ